MATIGPGRMDITYIEGQNIDDVMRITNNSKNSELMVFSDNNNGILTIENVIQEWNILETLIKFNNKDNDEQ